ncbi:hypothetical protein MKR22_11755 [Staphylococcus haemolyticus]|uniref:hypothetical protein n=1 Tax=Staphylococcus sp. AtHG25 TaxID=1938895 RepID=UPI000DA02AF0|nr:hypothetical protein [Staphylococcus sp. AtHG25]MCH4486811.1 hypothetical protein [Staphylococcus haemolyticus]MCH4500817.1 hypothetical protein [Staphylococcus haemolyticus]PYE04075.1 hypothetical protein BDW31_1313 [Staphylococcus sp. AtHG25]
MDIFLRILNFILASIPNWLGFPTELIKKRKKGFSKEQIEKEQREKKKTENQ